MDDLNSITATNSAATGTGATTETEINVNQLNRDKHVASVPKDSISKNINTSTQLSASPLTLLKDDNDTNAGDNDVDVDVDVDDDTIKALIIEDDGASNSSSSIPISDITTMSAAGIEFTNLATLSPTHSNNECRRSARKKVTKFEVLDLFNKNRKTNKLIAPAPPRTRRQSVTFSERKAPSRRYSMLIHPECKQESLPASFMHFDITQLNNSQTNIENLNMPKKSLIVTQVTHTLKSTTTSTSLSSLLSSTSSSSSSSSSTTTTTTITTPNKLIEQQIITPTSSSAKDKLDSHHINMLHTCEMKLPRRRGRPRKITTDIFDASNSIETLPELTSNASNVQANTNNTASVNADIQVANNINAETQKNVNLRVALRRMNFSRNLDNEETSSSAEKTNEDATGTEEENTPNLYDDIIVLSPLNEIDAQIITTENSQDSNSTTNGIKSEIVQLENDVITLSSLSESQETVNFEVVSADKDSEAAQSPITVNSKLATDNSNSLISIHESENSKKLYEDQSKSSTGQNIEQMDLENIRVETQTLLQILATVQNQQDNNKKAAAESSVTAQIDLKPSATSSPRIGIFNEATNMSWDDSNDSKLNSDSAKSASRVKRTRRKSIWVMNDASNSNSKTLEETFAEIAAQSSKAILDGTGETLIVTDDSNSQDSLLRSRRLTRRKTYCGSLLDRPSKLDVDAEKKKANVIQKKRIPKVKACDKSITTKNQSETNSNEIEAELKTLPVSLPNKKRTPQIYNESALSETQLEQKQTEQIDDSQENSKTNATTPALTQTKHEISSVETKINFAIMPVISEVSAAAKLTENLSKTVVNAPETNEEQRNIETLPKTFVPVVDRTSRDSETSTSTANVKVKLISSEKESTENLLKEQLQIETSSTSSIESDEIKLLGRRSEETIDQDTEQSQSSDSLKLPRYKPAIKHKYFDNTLTESYDEQERPIDELHTKLESYKSSTPKAETPTAGLSLQKRRFSMFSEKSNDGKTDDIDLLTSEYKFKSASEMATQIGGNQTGKFGNVPVAKPTDKNRPKSEDDTTDNSSSASTSHPTEVSTPTYSQPSTPVPTGESPTFELSKDSPTDPSNYSNAANSSTKSTELSETKSDKKCIPGHKRIDGINIKNTKSIAAAVHEDSNTAASETASQTSSSVSPIEETKPDTPVISAPTPTPSLLDDETIDPLKDIEKFIADGVNLLKRDYKIDDDSVDTELSATLNNNSSTASEFAERLARLDTPADTPEPPSTPSLLASTPPPSMTADDTQLSASGVRRSHRIKKKPLLPKASVARGVVRDKERRLTTDGGEECTVPYSMDQQLIELAIIENINERFLKSERLNTFHMIRENVYRCSRMISKETVDMQCECFLTAEEEASGQLGCGEGCINRMIMIECGPHCSNKDRCTNKRFQKQLCSPCRVFRTEKKGCGIVAEIQIPPGEFIMEYVGEVIDSEEFERRQFIYGREKNRHYYFMALRSDAIIDATSKGNISRFINHSCDPNAETQKWTVNGELRIGFFSRKAILPGEEITFDYQYQRYGRDAQPCFCEAKNCRGWIGKKPTTDDEFDSETGDESSDELEMESGDDSQESKRSITRKSSTPKPRKRITKLGVTKKIQRRRKTDQARMQQSVFKMKDRDINKKRTTSSDKSMPLMEDPDVLEEVTLLSRSGLKNQSNTLQLSRVMVRAKLVKTRLNLLSILRQGELPCRRLFLDYHGLRLLHGWMNENGNDYEFRLTLLKTMDNLPIPNKTVLTDCKIYSTVKSWLTIEPHAHTHSETRDESIKELTSTEIQELSKRISNLLTKWDSLPEIFRIPKRIERIEQMKEHEREADRLHTMPALEHKTNPSPLNSDRYKRDRFGRDIVSRYTKTITSLNSASNGNGHGGVGNGKPVNNTTKIGSRRFSDAAALPQPAFDRHKYLSKELRRELFERKVARDEAEKRMAEERRIFEAKCNFFGLDPLTYNPKNIPAYSYEDTGEWFNAEGIPVPSPPRCGNAPPPPATLSTNPAHYILPEIVEHLPASWSFAITPKGYLYYYNLTRLIAQWEPPTEHQLQKEDDDEEKSSSDTESETEPELLVKIDGEYAATLTQDELKHYIDEKVTERRQRRYERLVSVRTISPRREEDRIYNQNESRKYKENKEKIRRRKEVYRRRRQESALTPKITANLYLKPLDGTVVPIQDYLYSSDELSDLDDCNISPLIDVIVQDDKIVDELDALNSRRHLKRQLPLPQLNLETSSSKRGTITSSTAGGGHYVSSLARKQLPMPPIVTAITSSLNEISPKVDEFVSSKRQLPLPPLSLEPSTSKAAAAAAAAAATTIAAEENRLEQKRRRLNRERRLEDQRSNVHISSNSRDKFRCEMAVVVVDTLKPYRKETCTTARITSDTDFNHLARRLTHYIMTKEVKYCKTIGQPLIVNESVKHKAREYIKIYLQKYGEIYKRPDNGQEFKEIPIPLP